MSSGVVFIECRTMPDNALSPCGPAQPLLETQRLAALRAFSIVDTPREVEFDRLVKLAAELCETPMAAISIIDEHRLWFKATWGLSIQEMDLSMAFCTHGIRQPGFYQVADALSDPLYRNNPMVTGDASLRFYAGYPLRTQGGQVLGMLAVLDSQPRALTPKKRDQLQTLATLAMVTLELRRRQLMVQHLLGGQAQNRSVLLQLSADVARIGYWQLQAGSEIIEHSDEALSLLGHAPGESLTIDAMAGQIAPDCRDDWKAALAGCFASGVPMDIECAVQSGDLQLHLRWLASPEIRPGSVTVTRLVGVVQDVSEFREIERAAHRWNERFRLVAQLTSDALWEWDVTADSIWWGERMFHLLGHRKAACRQRDALELVHPDDRARVEREVAATLASATADWSSTFRLRRGDGSWAWVEDRAHVVRDGRGRPQRMVGCLRDVSQQVEMEAQRRADEQRIHQLAFHDQLTGLPNRVALLDRLQHAMAASRRHQQHGALMFVDLDNFKTLNDAFGHDAGDRLLQQVGRRLADCVRALDTVARVGGDEFVVLLEELGCDQTIAGLQAESLAKKMLAGFARPFDLGQAMHDCTASIGVTLFDGMLGVTDELLKQADLAMYEAKQSGRNSVRFFDPRMQQLVMQRATLESDLRRASLQHEFVLHYQPQWTRDGRLAGMEALLRWHHPQRGLVFPDEFIGACEESGLILPLGRWVLQSACAQLAGWMAAGLPEVRTSINVSPRQLHSPDFVGDVRAALQASGVPAASLSLELTESMLLHDVEGSIAKMQELRALGVRFALDDFGTGYSSLSLLQRLPLDHLKIDQSFVHSMDHDNDDNTVVRSIISLGKNLKLAVIAEGIESSSQQQRLASWGCDEFQGYLHGRSMPAEEAARLIGAQ